MIPRQRAESSGSTTCYAANPDRGATELERLNRDWSGRARPEECYALAAALQELEETGLVAGRARAWILLVIAWTRVDRGETTQLGDTAAEALRLAGAAEDRPAVADAQCLLGEVRQTQGDLDGAQAAFGEYLRISRRLAEQDPSNAGWQRGLALACLRVARLEAKAERHSAALPLYVEASRIFAALSEWAPGIVQWAEDRAMVEAELTRCRSRVSG